MKQHEALVTPAFRAEVRSVMQAIIGFAALYLLLMVAALVLMGLSVLAGVGIIMVHPNFVTLAVGGGIMFLGIMVCVFMVKFIFMRTKAAEPVSIMVRSTDQPELIRMINELADELEAPRPKRVILVPEVNAAVSYESTFWSMFLPVKKNLRIGLGLVNSLNVGELRAVLAHEFGHFSQRSMKLGSYVYTVNRAIFDLVQHRDSWDRTLDGWAESGGVFGWFAIPTAHIVQAVRGVLAKAYGRINRKYYSLSRQMEFHADSLAALSAGGPRLITALLKVEYAGMAWESTLNDMGMWLNKGRTAEDVFAMHTVQVGFLRGLAPDTPADRVFDDIQKERITWRPRLVVKDQWASHPTLTEREENVARIGVYRPTDERPAWVLFRDAGHLRTTMTSKLYANAEGVGEAHGTISPEEHRAELKCNEERFRIDDRYNGVLRDRWPAIVDEAEISAPELEGVPAISTFYTKEVADRHGRLARTRADHHLLLAVKDSAVDVETFELDGVKYARKDAQACAERLARELESEEAWSKSSDRQAQIANILAARAMGRSEELKERTSVYLEAVKEHRTMTEVLEQGNKVHAMAIAKPRFDQREWSELGNAADVMYARLKGALEHHDHHLLLAGDEHVEEIRALDRVKTGWSAGAAFEPDVFWGLYRNVGLLEAKAREKVHLALKGLTDLQLTWIPSA
ncbi:MAG: M48 family metallopeptidase [Flavobacteriales bacterium]|nr:M48 family metallopeptidase [Flavobacteriales bacterium]